MDLDREYIEYQVVRPGRRLVLKIFKSLVSALVASIIVGSFIFIATVLTGVSTTNLYRPVVIFSGILGVCLVPLTPLVALWSYVTVMESFESGWD